MKKYVICLVLVVLLVAGSTVFADGIVSYAQISSLQTGTWGGVVSYAQGSTIQMSGSNDEAATNTLYCRLVSSFWKIVKTQRIYGPDEGNSWEYNAATTGKYCVENNPEGPNKSGCIGFTRSEG
jgi:hypothetical protein